MLHPAAGVDEVGKAHRMALREAVVGERRQLVVDDLACGVVDTVCTHTFVETRLEPLHSFVRSLRSHGLTKLIGLRRSEPGNVDRHLHQLFLEQRNAKRFLQRLLQQRMQIGDWLEPVATTNIRMHRPALNRPRTDQRHLHHEVVKRARLQPGQRGHLGPTLDLKHSDGVRSADHFVDIVFLRNLRQFNGGAMELLNHVYAIMQRA